MKKVEGILTERLVYQIVDVDVIHGAKRSEVTLWHVDLGLSVAKVDVNATLYGLAVSGRVENIADDLTLSERVISHLEILGIVRVGECDEELAA